MKKVVIPKKGTYKCVVLSDGTNKVFRADIGEYHKDVVSKVTIEEPELDRFYTLGGGRIEIGNTCASTNPNTIHVYGHSLDFGYMNRDVVEELLSEYCKEIGMEFINASGEGY
jgi:hypothetical protein